MRTEVVVNANAAAFAADPRQIAAVQRAAAGARRVVVTHDLGELERAAAEMKTAGVDRVVLCGGDGTFMAGLSALVASGVDPLPEICLAPGGTVATVARNLGQKQGLLAAVRRQSRVGIVSNNLTAEQEDKLRHCGLDSLIDFMVTSEDVGMLKPEPGIFQAALAAGGFGAEQAVMVGDNWEVDIVGALAVGLRCIWFDREGLPRALPASVERITGLAELLA